MPHLPHSHHTSLTQSQNLTPYISGNTKAPVTNLKSLGHGLMLASSIYLTCNVSDSIFPKTFYPSHSYLGDTVYLGDYSFPNVLNDSLNIY